jgi:hypothetical protein
MHLDRRGLLTATALAAVQTGRLARAQPARENTIRLGALTDMSGPYRD